MVLSLTVLLGALGLAVDVGTAYYTKQSAQAAADAAAMAAASYASSSTSLVACGGSTSCTSTATACSNPPTSPPTTNFQAGCLYAQSNGFVNNGTTQFVTMNGNLGATTAPPGASGNVPTYWVQANVTAKNNTLFGRFGGMPQFTINASSIAAVEYLSAGACIYVLDPTANGAFTASGGSIVNATCGIFVNSNSASAFTASGSAHVTSTQILVNGGASYSSAIVAPTPITNAGPQSDPFPASVLPNPTFNDVACTAANTYSSEITTAVILAPGTWCGNGSNGLIVSHSGSITFSGGGDYVIKDGLTIKGSATASFGAGTYIINGSGSGGVAVDFANGVTVSGSGVMFFLTGQYSGHTIGNVAMSGAAIVNLSAPSGGTYNGILFMQDRSMSYTNQNSFSGSSSTTLTGSLYFPTTTVAYSGGSTSGSYTAVVAKKLTVSGSATFKNDPSGMYTGLGSTVRGLIQ